MNLGNLSKKQREWARTLSDKKRAAYLAARTAGSTHDEAKASVERPARRTKATTANGAKRFAVADATGGVFPCRTCGLARPVTSFPTVGEPGGDTRGTECRSCRDARTAAA